MKEYIKKDPWKIIEEEFIPEYNRISESLFSIGNGRMGQRANFEEKYSGDLLQGSYNAGVYYPDKTRVGWWKNGYPEYFAKVLNSANWIGINVEVDGEDLDLAKAEILEFRRELNMKEGYLLRKFKARMKDGNEVEVEAIRFCSMTQQDVGAIQYSVTPLNFGGSITLTPYIDFDVMNEDANYDEKFWEELAKGFKNGSGYVVAKTKKLDFHVATAMTWEVIKEGESIDPDTGTSEREKYVGMDLKIKAEEGKKINFFKYVGNCSSLYYNKESIAQESLKIAVAAKKEGFEELLNQQKKVWADKWEESDITIEGDDSAQQGIRFNIFQLNQTYTGDDERLNIGPKGFTGEKYGGSTYWDTEAYCLPFYLSTTDDRVGKHLLLYRYKHLQKAIENAEKLGFSDGAALYPMVTMNGEECHNEWEITFEEIHRNGAIAYAIYDYINHSGDENYLVEYGLEVLIAISRFWSQRVNFSESKQKYVMLGVTGPNEYENNVNNNWYTSTIALWTLRYTIDSIAYVKKANPSHYDQLVDKLNFNEDIEVKRWEVILNGMYLPEDNTRGIFIQNDGFLDKELMPAADLDPAERPINQYWSWDRILRSCFIKQADTLQGIYLFEDQYDQETIQHNFDFYEPMTVHESSLSPCVHAILAAKLGYKKKAYDMYLRTARLDLDDYNNDTEDGLHITSMAGTWMAFVKGFGGMRVKEGLLHFDPFIPDKWDSYSFHIRFRKDIIEVKVDQEAVYLINHSYDDIELKLYGERQKLKANESRKFENKKG